MKRKPIKISQRIKKICLCSATVIFCILLTSPIVHAAGDPLDSINKLSDFIFAAIRAIGIILLAFGVLQVGIALKSHDAGQRANGFLVLFGGLVITFTKEILDMIV